MKEWLNPDWVNLGEFLGIPVFHWICAGVGALVGFLLAWLIVATLSARLRALSEKRQDSRLFATLADVVAATRKWVLLLLAVTIALGFLEFGAEVSKWIAWAVGALVGVQVAFWICRLLINLLRHAIFARSARGSDSVIYNLVAWAVQLLVWSLLLMLLLANAGIEIGVFIASLGVGGIAIALAAKDVLQDLFASVVIGVDNPFEVGDFITFGSELGTVRKVGIKTTRITALSGEELVVGNSELLGYVLHNLSRRDERRVVFGFSVSLRTNPEQLEQIVAAVCGYIEEQDMTRLDRGHFLAIENNGYRFEFVYFMLDPAYGLYCDTQQRVNLRLMKLLGSMDVELASPLGDIQMLP